MLLKPLYRRGKYASQNFARNYEDFETDRMKGAVKYLLPWDSTS